MMTTMLFFASVIRWDKSKMGLKKNGSQVGNDKIEENFDKGKGAEDDELESNNDDISQDLGAE